MGVSRCSSYFLSLSGGLAYGISGRSVSLSLIDAGIVLPSA